MKITVGALKRQLAGFKDDDELIIQGELTFYRFKQRGPKLVQLEFGETVGFLSDSFKKRNPNACVVFISSTLAPGEVIAGPVDVEIT